MVWLLESNNWVFSLHVSVVSLFLEKWRSIQVDLNGAWISDAACSMECSVRKYV